MSTQKRPILTDEFLDELAKEVSQLYGGPEYETSDMPVKQDTKA